MGAMAAVAQMFYIAAEHCLVSINTISETENVSVELETVITRAMQIICKEME